jgi:hypothetical protein
MTLVKTSDEKVIGFYCPDKWENTTGLKSTFNLKSKDITSGSPFLFYCLDDQIQIMKHRDDRIPTMISGDACLMGLENGIRITPCKKYSKASASKNFYNYP